MNTGEADWPIKRPESDRQKYYETNSWVRSFLKKFVHKTIVVCSEICYKYITRIGKEIPVRFFRLCICSVIFF